MDRSYFVKPNNPILWKIAALVPEDKIISSETRTTIERLFDAAYDNQSDRTKPIVVGLAAPQIGISEQIILVDIAANGKGEVGGLTVYINPKIVWMSDDTNTWYEGCWSTDHVCGIVERPTTIKINAFSQDGKALEEVHTGYIARIFQHEIDHLHGKVFIDHVKDQNNLHWVDDEDWTEYRNNEAWRNWPKKCTFSRWQLIKGCSQPGMSG